jgi:hypothetical protein
MDHRRTFGDAVHSEGFLFVITQRSPNKNQSLLAIRHSQGDAFGKRHQNTKFHKEYFICEIHFLNTFVP